MVRKQIALSDKSLHPGEDILYFYSSFLSRSDHEFAFQEGLSLRLVCFQVIWQKVHQLNELAARYFVGQLMGDGRVARADDEVFPNQRSCG